MSSYIHNKKISSSEYFDRIRKSGRDQFTVMPEFGVTVYDAINAPFDRDSNKPVYAHIPGVDKRPSQQKPKLSQQFQNRVFASIRSDPSRLQYLTPSERVAYLANQKNQMYKRKYSSAQFDAEFGPSAPVVLKKARTALQMRAASQKAAWQQKNSLATQVRRLIQGKKKDCDDQQRINGASVTSTRIYDLTSSGSTGVSGSTTGLVITDMDRAHLNTVWIRGTYHLRPISVTSAQMAATARSKCRVRHLVVWFYKPAIDPAAAGTLPPITEVLVSDAVDSMTVPEAANSGRFTVLSDRIIDMGRNMIDVNATLAQNQYSDGNVQGFSYYVKLNKEQFYKKNATQTNPGGHYSSSADAGQITKGMPVLYIIAEGGANAAGTDVGQLVGQNITTRLNYTA